MNWFKIILSWNTYLEHYEMNWMNDEHTLMKSCFSAWIQSILNMLITSSTSYLLLAPLEVSRSILATEGKELLVETIRKAKRVRKKIIRLYDFL